MPNTKRPGRKSTTSITSLRTSLEGWRCLAAVVDAGGYAQAAGALDKSQSAVSHQVARLQEQLGVALLRQEGRRAVLTANGRELLRRARGLLDQAAGLEQAADWFSGGAEAQVALAVDGLVPPAALATALASFADACPETRCELYETVLSGGAEALLEGRVDLAIIGQVPPAFVPEPLLDITFRAVAAPSHPLHQRGDNPAELTLADLRPHRQLVTRDSGQRRNLDAGWLGADHRWTVTNLATSASLVSAGLGFAWLPEHLIANALAAGQLLPLPLGQQSTRRVPLMLVQANPDQQGPAVQALVQALRGLSGVHQA